MKDAYSFTIDEEGMKKAYYDERGAYERIFQRLDLKYVPVFAMSGPMGGSASEEFLAPMAIGEDTFALAPSGKAWNVEALTTPELPAVDSSAVPAMESRETPDSKTIEDLVATANRLYPREDGREWTAADTLKTVAVTVLHPEDDDHEGPWREVIAVALPGDRQVDMKRLEAQFAPAELEESTEDDLKAHPEMVAGYMGPMVFGKQGEARASPNRCASSSTRTWLRALSGSSAATRRASTVSTPCTAVISRPTAPSRRSRCVMAT